MKLKLFPAVLALVVTGFAAANVSAQEAAYLPPYHPYSLDAELGTTGVGGAAAWRFTDHFGVRAGVDYFRYSWTATIEDVSYDAKGKLLTEPVTFDLFPWRDASFHISLGVAFDQNELTGTGVATGGTYTLNGQTFPAASVGTLNLSYKQQPVAPYVSIGGNLFYFDRARHWSLGGEAGVFYTGDAKVNLTRTGGVPNAAIDSALAAEQQTIAHNADKFKFWPVLKLSVNFSF